MALGGTAKKIQKLADTAEKLYEQIKDLQQRMINVEESVDASTQRLDRLEVESEKQRVLLEAVAEQHGIDVEQVLAEAAIEEAEPVDGEAESLDSQTDSDQQSAGGDATAGDQPAEADSPTVVDDSGNTVE
ncbi:DUF5798 family protein [Salinarchaeum laminariae]|uniref:DUF5798 family protein n=1 Tax=Salinarchaeum laminariae TaxID=869888 RepID=UPI0020BE7BF1|nr:DUF5798 family protein [Salinarchaeum laminariae]